MKILPRLMKEIEISDLRRRFLRNKRGEEVRQIGP